MPPGHVTPRRTSEIRQVILSKNRNHKEKVGNASNKVPRVEHEQLNDDRGTRP
jgi:hypothetical protein